MNEYGERIALAMALAVFGLELGHCGPGIYSMDGPGTLYPHRIIPVKFADNDLSHFTTEPWLVSAIAERPGLERRYKISRIIGEYGHNLHMQLIHGSWKAACDAMLIALGESNITPADVSTSCDKVEGLLYRLDLSRVDCSLEQETWFSSSCDDCHKYEECLDRCADDRPMYLDPSWEPFSESRPYLDRPRGARPEDDRCTSRVADGGGHGQQRADRPSDCPLLCESVEIERTRCGSQLRSNIVLEGIHGGGREGAFLNALASASFLLEHQGDRSLRWAKQAIKYTLETRMGVEAAVTSHRKDWDPISYHSVDTGPFVTSLIENTETLHTLEREILAYRAIGERFFALFASHCRKIRMQSDWSQPTAPAAHCGGGVATSSRKDAAFVSGSVWTCSL